MLPLGKQELVIVPKKEGYKTATILAHIKENGILDIITAKNVTIGQKPVNILRNNGTCTRMNKVTAYLERDKKTIRTRRK